MKLKNLEDNRIDSIFMKFAMIKKPYRIIIFISALVSLVGSVAFFLLQPRYERLKRYERENDKFEKQFNASGDNETVLKRYAARLKKADENLKEALTRLPEKNEISSLLTNISETGQDVGLEFLLFQPETEIEKDLYIEIPVSITVKGAYHDIGMFFDGVSNLPGIVNIKDIRMVAQTEGDTIIVSCLAVTYKVKETPSG